MRTPKRLKCLLIATTSVTIASVLCAQGVWTWQQQCSSSNEWSAICSITDNSCGGTNRRFLNNWGLTQCNSSPSLPGLGAIVIFPSGANALLNSNVDILSIDINNNAIFRWQGGTLILRNPTNNNLGSLTNLGQLIMVSTSSRTLSGILVNSGTLVHEAGTTSFSGATLQNSSTAEVRGGSWFDSSGTNSLLNTGTLNKTTTSSFSISVNVTNSGLIDVRNGTLISTDLVQTTGEVRTRRGAILSVFDPLVLQGGKLTGAGRVNGALNNTAGVVSPGIDDPNQPDQNPLGILTINGDLVFSNDAVLEVELSGTNNTDTTNPQYDQLVVVSDDTRMVQVNGKLRIKARNGYTPALGDTYDILVRSGFAWNATGAFRIVEVDRDTLPCIAFEVQYLSDRVKLVTLRVGADNPDINRDGCVDDADLLAVLFAFGQTGSGLPEDTNCDAVVDDADLLSVLFAFGTGC